jgi:hypothetical protein
MTLDEIFEEWGPDCKIEPLDLSGSLQSIPMLINKYRRYLAIESKEQRKLEARLKQLVQLKTEYIGGFLNGTEELKELGWPPYTRTVLKGDVARFVEADRDVMKLTEQLAEQKEKTSVLFDVLKELGWRSNVVRGMIDWRKITEGIA